MQFQRLLAEAGVCVWLAAGFLTMSAEPRQLRTGVVAMDYRGWPESLVVEATDVEVKLVVAPAVGGRIVEYSLDGQNILWSPPGIDGVTLATSPKGFATPGHQVDIGPELRGIPRHLLLWLGQYVGDAPRDDTVRVVSAPDAGVGVQLGKEITLEPETGALGIVQRMKNVTTTNVAYCLWDRTLCEGGGFAFFPLNKKSRFAAKWALLRKPEGKGFYDGDQPEHANVRVLDGVLVAKCGGKASKLGADSDAEWIAYTRGRLLFVKYYPWFPKGSYTDGGNSVELYFDEGRAELEPLSPEITLKPGETYEMPQKWTLVELKEPVTTHEQARALARKIPPSPFKR
jgi:hypothetical protein